MIYQIGMLCKHFKGKSLEDKNIYKIIKLGVEGKDINSKEITYTGDAELNSASNLVVYANIFQNNKLFAREYEDISAELTLEKQKEFAQKIKVQPLTDDEIAVVNLSKYVELKQKHIKKESLSKS